MLNELTASVRRWTTRPLANEARTPLVRLGETPVDAVHFAQTDIGMLRGMTPAAADTNECMCPDSCERDHANE